MVQGLSFSYLAECSKWFAHTQNYCHGPSFATERLHFLKCVLAARGGLSSGAVAAAAEPMIFFRRAGLLAATATAGVFCPEPAELARGAATALVFLAATRTSLVLAGAMVPAGVRSSPELTLAGTRGLVAAAGVEAAAGREGKSSGARRARRARKYISAESCLLAAGLAAFTSAKFCCSSRRRSSSAMQMRHDSLRRKARHCIPSPPRVTLHRKSPPCFRTRYAKRKARRASS
jgi:hypothetical protein